MLTGDEEEHAILLCNFFLHLGKKAMLLLGSGIPEGPTAYVVTWEKDKDIWVWNASTGDHFSVQDNRNPLHSVGCLVNAENVSNSLVLQNYHALYISLGNVIFFLLFLQSLLPAHFIGLKKIK